ncbi:MAG: DUF4926 domain-containing protein [Hyphomonadaceae bacterium]|nr:DUF4926 domain-containing protein [Hyphomonadaceae bacterium]
MTNTKPALLDAVALLTDQADLGLIQGQVGTVVELFEGDYALVEFCDGDGVAFAVPTLPLSALLRLAYEQVAA